MRQGPEAFRALRYPHPLRRHQAEALDALDAAWAADRRRAWVVLPPGAGKTLVGCETIRRVGTRAVVLSPNSAIQGQWVRTWLDLADATGANPVTVGTDRELRADVVSLTYQSLAVFHGAADREREGVDEEEGPDGELGRLHPNGRALVESLRDAGPLTLVLDECHHLLEVWGRLLAEVLALLPQARVLGLTATPAATLTRSQQALVDELFGDVVHSSSIPAGVREGYLAPFAELAWLTPPAPAETAWLDEQATAFETFPATLLDPDLGSTSFRAWVQRHLATPGRFELRTGRQPDLAAALLRLGHAGHVDLPEDLRPPAGAEQLRRPPTADDWARLVDGWFDDVLAGSEHPADQAARDVVRGLLPVVGHQLTTHGARRVRTGVDRVLARSEAKSRAAVEIVRAEHRALGARMAMLVICDQEDGGAVRADLRGVLHPGAGSARFVLGLLLADPVVGELGALMVTGRTVAGAPATLDALRRRVDVDLELGEPDEHGVAELTAAPGVTGWNPRVWVRAATDHFLAGECRVLVGTRALLGEGWDAPKASGLVDLSSITSASAVTQTRGRTLRVDPLDPSKVAVNWTVVCLHDRHPQGDLDWQRLVAKHQGYVGVDATGDVVDGVARIHPSFSPHRTPSTDVCRYIDDTMLARVEQRSAIAVTWRVGEPYRDQLLVSVWLTPTTGADRLPETAETARPTPPVVRLTEDGLEGPGSTGWTPLQVLGTAVSVPGAGVGALSALGLGLGASGPVGIGLAAVVLGGWSSGLAAAHRVRRDRVRALRLAASRPPSLPRLAWVVADALHALGRVGEGATAVEWHRAEDGSTRIRLEPSSADPLVARRESELFATVLAEAVAPVHHESSLLSRPVSVDGREVDGTAEHPVPPSLGGTRAAAVAFEEAWRHWVSGARLTASAVVPGTNPCAALSVQRLTWR
ncbi:DEAD/DEAH box helicase family protein [Nocardioides nanhaiensis]|uniref:DEAD/DEAH box helicase family protein n=1 Tax=Nocardioides nanhaiensis TaxID=1476871 RepID=A0ABP8X374_9ACTN